MDEGTVTSASEWDLTTIHEEEFENHATYIVPDRAVEPGVPNRAEATLPRNLVLRPSQALTDVSNLHDCLDILFIKYTKTFFFNEINLFLGSGRMELRIHPTRHSLWTPRGRNICQRCST